MRIEILKGDCNVALNLVDTSADHAWQCARLMSKSCGYTVQLTDATAKWKVLFFKGTEIT